MTFLPTLLCAAAVAAMVHADATGRFPQRAVAKTSAAGLFVTQAVINGAWGSGTFGRAVLVGLILSAVGDVLLLGRRSAAFLAGLTAFLAAHLAYGAAFWADGAPVGAAAIAWIGLLGLLSPLTRRFFRVAGRMGPAVVAYITVISGMVALAIALAATSLSPRHVGLVAAAVAFAASDITVARDRFESAGFANKAVGTVLYFAAQLAFAWLAFQ